MAEINTTEKKNPRAGNRAAGKRFEKKLEDFLVTLGYRVQKAGQRVLWLKDKKTHKIRPISLSADFFGCIDLIGIHPNKCQTLFVQATLDHVTGRKKDEIQQIPWNFSGQKVQLWRRQDGIMGGIKVEALQPEGTWHETIFRLRPGEWPTCL